MDLAVLVFRDPEPRTAAPCDVPCVDRRLWICAHRGGDLAAAQQAWPTIAIWHGDDDTTVLPGSADDLARQWANVHGAVTVAADDRISAGRRADFWRAPGGGVAVERHRIAQMAHGAALKTGGADGCGASGPHLIDIGVSSRTEIARSWRLCP